MAASSGSLHEDPDVIGPDVIDQHRAVVSIMEELEAVDWYHQRAAATADAELAAVLAHNRDEEIEHAAMTLEWLRRNNPVVDQQLRTYLFTEGPITQVEEEAEAGAGPDADADAAPSGAPGDAAGPGDGDLKIRSLRGEGNL